MREHFRAALDELRLHGIKGDVVYPHRSGHPRIKFVWLGVDRQIIVANTPTDPCAAGKRARREIRAIICFKPR